MGEANRLGRSGVLAAAVLLVVGVLVLAAVAQPAKAAFPGQNGDIAYAKFSPSSEEARIFTMNPDGSEQTLLEPGSSPSYSPNGAQVVFERFIGDGEEEFNQDIYVVDSEGTSGPVQVTSGPAYDHSPTFLDNDTVAFIRDSRRNGTDIFKKQIGVPGAENLTNTPVMYEETLAATFNGTDAKIAFTRYNRSSDIFIMNDDGSEVTNLTRTGRIDEYDPDWSPNAQKITFTSYRFSEGPGEEFEEHAEISVINANGNGRKDLTDGPAIDLAPAFSPNGAKIAFTRATFSREQGETADIFVMKADGTNERRLTDTRAFEFGPDWQPLVL
jgi:Tol biopolymer transport system component